MTQPPRQMAIDRGHPHYRTDWQIIGPKIEVLQEGKVATCVVAYDCDAGTLERYVTDENGVPVIDRENECLTTETLLGRVEVRWKEAADA